MRGTQSDRGLRWAVLLDGDRLALAAAVLAAVFLVVLALLEADVVGVSKTGPMRNLFAGVVTGVFTVVSIILAINQLVLSRVFGSPEELAGRMEGTRSFRRSVERHADLDAAPTDPGAFLSALVRALGEHADRLGESTTSEEVREYAGDIRTYADGVADDLEGTRATFPVLSAVLRDSYSGRLRRARELRRALDLDAEAASGLETVVELLKSVGVARQYFKTIYVQQELAQLSRLLMYLGVPALVVAAVTVLLYARPGGPVLSGFALRAFVAAALTVSFAPLVVLLSYVLRIATIARLTATVGPFTPAEEGW